MKKIAVVTGANSGIGLCAASELYKKGFVVYDLSRRESSNEGIIHISTDITDGEAVTRSIDEIIRREGRIDILVNNAGAGISGAVEFTDAESAKRLLDISFFALDSMCRAVIPYMRENNGGRIVNIGSVAGAVPIPFQTYYSASKAAVHAYTLALSNELLPFNISVCALMPGDIKTGFTSARKKSYIGNDIYLDRIDKSVSKMEKSEINGMPPEKAGKFIAKLCIKKKVKPLYSLGLSYKAVCLLAKLLPCGLVNKIVYALYLR